MDGKRWKMKCVYLTASNRIRWTDANVTVGMLRTQKGTDFFPVFRAAARPVVHAHKWIHTARKPIVIVVQCAPPSPVSISDISLPTRKFRNENECTRSRYNYQFFHVLLVVCMVRPMFRATSCWKTEFIRRPTTKHMQMQDVGSVWWTRWPSLVTSKNRLNFNGIWNITDREA